MQKNLFLGFLVILISGICSGAYAKTIEVEALEAFTTANPPSTITIRLLNELELTDETLIEAGTEMCGSVVDVVSPKRLKRNATFSFVPHWYIDAQGSKHIVNEQIKASYTTTLNTKQLAKSAALSVGGHFVKGLSMGVAAIEGAVENEEGNVLKSSAKSMYKSSPLSYASKGNDIIIEQNDVFYLKFPDKNKDKTEKE